MGDFAPFDRPRKTRFLSALGHSRSKASGTWAENESVHINFSRSSSSCTSNNYESGWLGRFGVWERFPGLETNKLLDLIFGRGYFESCIHLFKIDQKYVQMIPNGMCDTFRPMFDSSFFYGLDVESP